MSANAKKDYRRTISIAFWSLLCIVNFALAGLFYVDAPLCTKPSTIQQGTALQARAEAAR